MTYIIFKMTDYPQPDYSRLLANVLPSGRTFVECAKFLDKDTVDLGYKFFAMRGNGKSSTIDDTLE